jgi:hypothetical protein
MVADACVNPRTMRIMNLRLAQPTNPPTHYPILAFIGD